MRDVGKPQYDRPANEEHGKHEHPVLPALNHLSRGAGTHKSKYDARQHIQRVYPQAGQFADTDGDNTTPAHDNEDGEGNKNRGSEVSEHAYKL